MDPTASWGQGMFALSLQQRKGESSPTLYVLWPCPSLSYYQTLSQPMRLLLTNILNIRYQRYISRSNYILDTGYRVIYRDMVLKIG